MEKNLKVTVPKTIATCLGIKMIIFIFINSKLIKIICEFLNFRKNIKYFCKEIEIVILTALLPTCVLTTIEGTKSQSEQENETSFKFKNLQIKN